MAKRIVTDEDVDRALHFLAESAADVGEARRRVLETEALAKHTRAIKMLASKQTTQEGKRADAEASPEWLQAELDAAVAAGEWQRQIALREAATAKIEAWRSESANYRGMKV